MFQYPRPSAMITRMLGGLPAPADCCACAVVIGAADPKPAAARIEVPVNSMLRRLKREDCRFPCSFLSGVSLLMVLPLSDDAADNQRGINVSIARIACG